LHKHIFHETNGTSVEYCVISDSVFLFIEKEVDSLLYVTANIFRNCIASGILLRAGMAYGEYNFIKTKIETKNIYGMAVTKAVAKEQTGKGCRIFIDEDLPKRSKLNPKIFHQYKNYIDYSEIDIFEWPLFNKKYYVKIPDINNKETKAELKALLLDNCKLLANLRYAPDFIWNEKSNSGRIHLVATIEYITDITNKIISKLGQFENLPLCVSPAYIQRTRKTVNKLIDEYRTTFNV
jgi:hypothetical protein